MPFLQPDHAIPTFSFWYNVKPYHPDSQYFHQILQVSEITLDTLMVLLTRNLISPSLTFEDVII